jgi:predicted SAM-dependent methyltransferase
MIRQQIKDAYFGLNRWLVMPNNWLARLRYRTPPRAEGFYIHLGSGPVYIPGMINCEGNLLRKKDFWLDLKNRLPFPDSSAAFIYLCHTLEHFFPDDALRILREMRRVIRPDGVVRIATPSLEHGLRIAAGHQVEDPQRRFDDPHGQAVDYLFCDGQHKYAYSFSVMENFAKQAGFTSVKNLSVFPGRSARQEYGPVEVGDELAGSLIVELRAC